MSRHHGARPREAMTDSYEGAEHVISPPIPLSPFPRGNGESGMGGGEVGSGPLLVAVSHGATGASPVVAGGVAFPAHPSVTALNRHQSRHSSCE